MAIATIIMVLILLGIYKLIKPPDIYKQTIQAETAGLKKAGLDYDNAVFIGTAGRKKVFIKHDTAHILVSGTTGAGKTVALSNIIKSGIDNNFPMLLVDGKGDIGRDSMLEIVENMKGDRKLYVINCTDVENSDTYNPFCNTSPGVIKDMLINLTEWSEEHYKANAERYIQKVIDLLRLSDQKLSFQNIINYMALSKFKALASELTKQEIITKEEFLALSEMADESGKITQGSIARYSAIAESELGSIFHEDGIDIYTALQENAIILFILNPLLYPELSPMIGNLAIIDSKKAVAKFYKSEVNRIFFLFDEINVYTSKSFLNLVNKSRSANITCTLATQSLSDLDDVSPALKEQIIENCNNYIIMRQNSAVSAEQWANVIGTRETIEVTQQIDEDGATGKGSARRVREFIFHPDEIKQLDKGQALYISKDNAKIKCKVAIHKPF